MQEQILRQIGDMIETVQTAFMKHQSRIDDIAGCVKPKFRKSAKNLIQYSIFRKFDMRETQNRLRSVGLTRFAHAEGRIEASLLQAQRVVYQLLREDVSLPIAELSIDEASDLLKKHSEDLLGKKDERRVKIMVTLPTEAAFNYQLVEKMIENGMNVARVNCAHDSATEWQQMIKHVHTAAKKFHTEVKIAMDLAGPKLRTGEIVPRSGVIKSQPERNDLGQVVRLALIAFGQSANAEVVPVSADFIDKLSIGDHILFTDARGRKRVLPVIEKKNGFVFATCNRTCYFTSGLMLETSHGYVGEVERIEPRENFLTINPNDKLHILKPGAIGHPARKNADGEVVEHAAVASQSELIFDYAKVGEAIFFDDGKIQGKIESIEEDLIEVNVIHTKAGGARLKAEKGINLPDTFLPMTSISAKDKEDLAFAIKYADIVNVSFVNSADDLRLFRNELKRIGAPSNIGVVAKIETRFAFQNLIEILLELMQFERPGLMIARGDLAIETGWEEIGIVQETLLAYCGAAHIPVIWATQVLESYAKKGIPSRAEITDAAKALRAEAVMLNKGPYIIDTLHFLNTALIKMGTYREKNESMLPKMSF